MTKATAILLRLTVQDKRLIQRAARIRQQNVAEYMRDLVVRESRRTVAFIARQKR